MRNTSSAKTIRHSTALITCSCLPAGAGGGARQHEVGAAQRDHQLHTQPLHEALPGALLGHAVQVTAQPVPEF